MADALFKAIGQKLDAGEDERELYNALAEHLWTGSFIGGSDATPVSQPRAPKARLECLLRTAIEIREKSQARLHNLNTFPDLDFSRSLTEEETKSLHNAWMNDVESWMSEECFGQYERLIEKANELDSNKGKGNQCWKAWRDPKEGSWQRQRHCRNGFEGR